MRMTRSGESAIWITLAAGMALAVAVFMLVTELEQREDRLAFEQAAFDRIASIEGNAIRSLEVVSSTADFLGAIDEIEAERFRAFAAPALERQMSIAALEWIPRVTAKEREAHERAARSDGFSGYRIMERGPGGDVRPAGDRAVYFPVRFVEPVKGNEHALGFDVRSDGERRATLERARDSGTLAVSGPVRLVQDKGEYRPSVLAVYPVFGGGTSPETLEGRRERIAGFALGVFRVEDIVATPFVASGQNTGLNVYVFDVAEGSLIHKELAGKIAEAAPGVEADALASGVHESRLVRLGGREWRIIARPAGTWATPWQAWAAAAALLVITALLTAYLQASRRQTRRLTILAKERSSALDAMVHTLTRLQDISSDIRRPFDHRLADAMDLGREIFGMPLAMVSRINAGRYTVMHARGPEDAPEPGSVFPVSDTYCERTLAADGPIGFHSATGTEWEKHPCYSQFKLEAYLGAPVRVAGEPYGTLNFTSPTPRAKRFSEEERAFVALLAQWIGNEIERARSLEALSESVDRYQSVLRDSLQGVVIDRDGVPLYANRAFARIFGYEDEQEVMALPSLDAIYAPGELERVRGYRSERLRGGNHSLPSRYEFRGRRKNGEEIWCEHLAQPVEWLGEQAVRTFTQDVTARRRASEEVERLLESRTAELRLRDRAIHAANNGILITDPGQRDNPIIYVNPAFERLTGYASAEILGRNCRFLQNDDRDQPDLPEVREAIAEGRPVQAVLRNYRKDGALFWNALEIAPVRDSDGNVTHFIGVQTDITEERRREEEIRALQRLDAVGRLTGGVAHDFNNLLTVIVGNLRLVSGMLSADDDARKRIDGAVEAAFRGASLVRQLLAFARRQVLEPEVLDPAEAVSSTCALLERTLGGSVTVETRIEGKCGRVRVDPAQLETAIVNLALNARDAMPQGGRLAVGVRHAHLDRSFVNRHPDARPGEYVCISVDDTGTGMSDEVERQAVEPFFTTKEVGKGSGLGLSMVYGFIKQSGGYLDIESEEGAGTGVRLYLPALAEVEAHPPAASEDQKSPPGGNESVLVVEDEREVREITVSLLEMLGYRVKSAEDARSALEILADGADVDLLLADVVMPGGMSGVDLAREARRLKPDIRVLYVSGHAADAIPLDAAEDLNRNLLKKPYADDELARRVRAALDGDSSSRRRPGGQVRPRSARP